MKEIKVKGYLFAGKLDTGLFFSTKKPTESQFYATGWSDNGWAVVPDDMADCMLLSEADRKATGLKYSDKIVPVMITINKPEDEKMDKLWEVFEGFKKKAVWNGPCGCKGMVKVFEDATVKAAEELQEAYGCCPKEQGKIKVESCLGECEEDPCECWENYLFDGDCPCQDDGFVEGD